MRARRPGDLAAAAHHDATAPVRVLRYGERALLLEVDDHLGALALYDDLRRDPMDGVIDLVPAARTLLVTFVDEPSAKSAAGSLAARTVAAGSLAVGPAIAIPVTYDGPDLASVARRTGLTVDEVISKHATGEYLAAFVGFAPGFAYLTGLDPVLHVPRRSEPRPKVPRGSVAIAGEYTAVYPSDSPGGWQIIGHTTLRMWDLGRQPPALLQPGARVCFKRVDP